MPLAPTLALLFQPAYATDAATTRPPIRVEADQAVRVDGPTNDLFAFAQKVDVGHDIDDNAFSLAQQVTVHADQSVNGDMFAMTESTEVAGSIGGDLYVFAGSVVLREGGTIGGDVLVIAGDVDLRGIVGGDVYGEAGRVDIDGTIAGDVQLETGHLELGDQASIGGDLVYSSSHEASLADGARVGGEVRFTEVVEPVEQSEAEPEPEEPGFVSRTLSSLASTTFWKGWRYLGGLIVGTVLFGLGGRAATRPGRALIEAPGLALGVGFLLACALPAASTALMMMLIPLPLGLLGFTAWFVGIYLSGLVVGHALGDVLLARLRPGATGTPWVSMAVGLLLVTVGLSLPWVGTLVWLTVVFAGLGGMALALREGLRGDA